MSDLQKFYFLLDLFCMAITGWIFLKTRVNRDSQTIKLIFEHLVISLFALLVIDLIWIFIEGKPGWIAFVLNNIINIAYMSIMGYLSYSWFYHIAFSIFGKKVTINALKYISIMPLLILISLCILSVHYSLIFKIDENNVYIRGPLHPLQHGICYLYYVTACILLLIAKIKNYDHYKASVSGSKLFFVMLPLAGGILSLLFPIFPTTEVFVTLAILFYFGDSQISLISLDSLTGVNNKNTFDKILTESVGFKSDTHKLFVFLADINNFKQINDNYGHSEGDEILMEVAAIIKGIIANTDAEPGRIDSDEFIILRKFRDSTKAETFKFEIEKSVENTNYQKDRPFKISVSVGYSEVNTESLSAIIESIRAASAMMYEEKKRIHVLDKTLE